ncbi:SIR2 family protein [Arthrobacter sp. STN4]|uniref:SIR2 family protein n=1 Tax=Arthrobacter sp. STN4 TaxID=2923276 RepID=UPI002119D46A|nr:SIR2 family protein [Arthrobacter sp. STN4]MCQ9162774.1 SIR2 family protein [Arthrobacter sp. STN4]
MNLTVLSGNGLSTAFNPDLRLDLLCHEVIRRIDASNAQIGDSEERDLPLQTVANLMAEVARHLDGNDPTEDFEVLIGAFVAQRHAIQHMNRLARALAPEDEVLAQALAESAKFARSVSDEGISHVLEIISERSMAYAERQAPLENFVEAIASAFPGKITFANLNYDTMLHAALLGTVKSELCDLADGRRKITVKDEDGKIFSCVALRTTLSFPSTTRIRLLQLHGSYSWWYDPEQEKTELVVRFEAWQVRDESFLAQVRSETMNLRPAVVLSNQLNKTTEIRSYPFSLAYEGFGLSLRSSSHWLIVGYSFRDDAVNASLREALGERDRSARPKVLVITLGVSPSRKEVEQALGWGKSEGPSDWLTFHRDGVVDATKSNDWTNWSCSS